MTRNDGNTLMETLIASSIGVSLLLVVLALLSQFNAQAWQISKQLMLNQEIAVVTRRLVNDLTRAGSSDDINQVLMPVGSLLPVYVAADGHKIQYSYWDYRQGNSLEAVKNYVWRYNPTEQTLSVCYLTSSVASGAKSLGFDESMGCTSVFEPHRVAVSDFSVQSHWLNEQDRVRQGLNLIIELQLKQNPEINQSLQRQIWVRNGQ